MKLKLKMSMKILAAIKKYLISVNYLTKSKYHDNSNKLVIGKMKNQTGGLIQLNPKVYSFLVDNNE